MKEVCICANDRLIRVILGFAPRVTIIVDDTLKMILEREEKGWRLYDEEGVAAALLQGEAISARIAGKTVLLWIQEHRTKLYLHHVETLRIGRSVRCALVLKESFISQIHAELREEKGILHLRDCGSTNGTYVNERRVQSAELKPGDVIDLLAVRMVVGIGFVASDRPLPAPSYVPRACVGTPHRAAGTFSWLPQPLAEQIITLPAPPVLPQPPFQPLALQLGTGMTMALCSLLAYGGAQNVWLICGMVGGMVIWPLLNALYQRCAYRKKRKQQRNKMMTDIRRHEAAAAARMKALQENHLAWQRALQDPDTRICGSQELWLCPGTFTMQAVRWALPDDPEHLYDALTQMDTRCADIAMLCQARPFIWLVDAPDPLLHQVLMQLLKQRADAEICLCKSDPQLIGRLRFLQQARHRAFTLSQAVREKGHRVRIVICEEDAVDTLSLPADIWVIVRSAGSRQPCADALVIDGRTSQARSADHDPVSFAAMREDRWDSFVCMLASQEQLGVPQPRDFLALFSCSRCEQLQAEERWQRQRQSGSLAALLGWDEQGAPVVLDAHEKGDGPHGILAGMTGSGKSELLLSYILSLSCSCSPESVSFFLIDYKGGSMANALRDLPHLCGMMTNLDEASLERVRLSLNRELTMRQEQFSRMMSKLSLSALSIERYQQLRKASDPPLGHLFIIVDEFAQLREEHAEFLNELRRAARIGRSLGIHLLLCTQKPGGIIDEQIRSNARFRICMKVQSREDSLDMLHGDQALALREPGEFILQVGEEERCVKGRGAYVNARYDPQRRFGSSQLVRILGKDGCTAAALRWQEKDDMRRQLSVIVGYLRACAKRTGAFARQVCAMELPRYAHCPPQIPMQLGWQDLPQRQSVVPLCVKEESCLICCPRARSEHFRLCYGAVIAQKEDALLFDLHDPEMRSERMLRQLFHLLRSRRGMTWVLFPDTTLFHDARYAQTLFSLLRRPEVHAVILTQECDHVLMSRISFRKMSFEVSDRSLLQEFFGVASQLPLLTHDECGICSVTEGLAAYLCLPQDLQRAKMLRQESLAVLRKKTGRSIGYDVNDGRLFFWPQAPLVIMICAHPGQCAAVRALAAAWCDENVRVFVGHAQEPDMRELVNKHGHEATVCWMGSGLDRYGYHFGFRSAHCTSTQMIVCVQEEEQLIQLWEEER